MGSLLIALQQVMNVMSMQTIVWFRFAVATVALAILLKLANRLPKLSDLNRYFFWTGYIRCYRAIRKL